MRQRRKAIGKVFSESLSPATSQQSIKFDIICNNQLMNDKKRVSQSFLPKLDGNVENSLSISKRNLNVSTQNTNSEYFGNNLKFSKTKKRFLFNFTKKNNLSEL